QKWTPAKERARTRWSNKTSGLLGLLWEPGPKRRSGILFISTPSKTKKGMSPTRFSGQKTFLIGFDTSDNRCRRVSSVHHGNRLRRFLRGLAQGCGPHF